MPLSLVSLFLNKHDSSFEIPAWWGSDAPTCRHHSDHTKKKKEWKNHDKNNPRVVNNTLDRIPKLSMLDLRLHFSEMCHHSPCWPFNWSWNGLCFFLLFVLFCFFFVCVYVCVCYSHSSRHLSMQNSRDSHTSVCNDEKCSHGKNVKLFGWAFQRCS